MPLLNAEDENSIDDCGIQVLGILHETVGPAEGLSNFDAADTIDHVYEEYMFSNPNGNTEIFLLCFWRWLCHFASEIPHDDPKQDYLVAIITALTELDSRDVRIWDKDTKLWGRLPLFAEGLPRAWEALPFDMPDEAISELREVVEGAIIPVRGSPDIVSADPTAIEDIKFKTAAAAPWIKYAGHVLYGRDEEVEATKGGPLWRQVRGKEGLCADRWNLWKRQFGAIRDCEDIDQETREISGDAFAVMEKVEQEAA